MSASHKGAANAAGAASAAGAATGIGPETNVGGTVWTSGTGIGPDTTVEELLERYPKASGFLRREWGIICLECGEPVWARLGELIRDAGVDPDEFFEALDAFLLESGDVGVG